MSLPLIDLFWESNWLVKTVMVGLIICSVWVWAIAIDKTMLFSRIRKAADRFEQAFWSGQSLEELYTSLAAKPGHSTGALFVAAMREWKRSFEGHARSVAGLQMRIEKVMDVAIAREVERMERWLLVLAIAHTQTEQTIRPHITVLTSQWDCQNRWNSDRSEDVKGRADAEMSAGFMGASFRRSGQAMTGAARRRRDQR